MLRMYNQYSKVINFAELQEPEEWELVETIGEGTYGEVFLAKNKVTGQAAAAKVLESIHEVIEEIEEEFQVLRELGGHPNIPAFFGIFLHRQPSFEDQIWLVMELCGGGSVTDLSKALIKQDSHLEECLIAHILRETLKALQHLHNHHVMHRDVKGHNILITEAGQVKLVDFGVSGHLPSTLATRKTHVGTPYWMAPEVIACEQQLDYSYDVRCDIWSLGVTAIELADGSPPLSNFDPRRALFRIPRNPPPTVKTPSEWSEHFNDFVAKCLVKDFEHRPFTKDLIDHAFFDQINPREAKEKLRHLTSNMEREIHEPDVTTKHGHFKSRRKSRRDIVATADDLAALEQLDEEVIVSQLFNRYSQGIIYTYIGDILLAVNPFTPLTIYSEEYARQYMNAARDDNPPHIYAVADQSFQMMMHNKLHQCIVISGESGAGKTESANFLVQQLTQLGKAPNRTLEDRILQVNPLMEAFGNAKTIINDNSSRFGKYLEMVFTTGGTVIGAKITEYLLEKSRVIHQAKGEQNFHVFYYVHDGLVSSGQEDDFHLKYCKEYRYISEYTGRSPDIATISVNRVKFKAIQHCFDIIGFQQEEVHAVYGILAAILHTGNIHFTETETQFSSDTCHITDMQLVDIVSQLLGIDAKDLEEALTTTGMVAKGEVIIRNNSPREALNARDAMAKALYGRLFSWIVNRISALLRPQARHSIDDETLVIGLLDIFGFENFEKNSFEQLCINIANEQIQYYFNQHIFAWEMQEYKNEGVDGGSITFVDNRPILDMFLMKPMGLLALLDEESHFPRATDQTLVDKFHQNIRAQVYSRPKADNLIFCIDHYAGKVEYDAGGFLEKNRDRLPVEIVNILRMSENGVVRALFRTPLTKTGNLSTLSSGASSASSSRSSALSSPISNANSGFSIQAYSSRATSLGGSKIYSALRQSHGHAAGSASMTRIQQTVATYFRYSLMDLLAKMVAGTPHFVRCIKPNNSREPGNYDAEKVMTQLRYTGVLETTRIRRQGFSHRIPFAEFLRRYKVLGFRWNEQVPVGRGSCQTLLGRLELQNWALGKSKVFLKYYHVEELARMYEELTRKVVIIQSCVRSFLAQNRFYRMRWQRDKAVQVIQKYARGWMARRRYQPKIAQRRKAAIQVQKTFRGYKARQKYVPILREQREAAVRIQKAFRGHHTRRKVRQIRSREDKSARVIQKAYRRHHAKTMARNRKEQRVQYQEKAATLIQTYFRMWKCKTLYQQLQQYKSQKELQLIYFGQQVDLYSKDSLENQMRNKDVPPQALSSDSATGPTPMDTLSGQARSSMMTSSESDKKDRDSRSAILAKVDKMEISEERKEHIRRLVEIKTLMPEAEVDYYHHVYEFVNGPEPYKVVIQVQDKPKEEAPLVEVNEEQKKKSKVLMDADADNYYNSIAHDVSTSSPTNGEASDGQRENGYANGYHEDIQHSSPTRKPLPLVGVASLPARPLPLSDSSASLAWDAPLESARERTLAGTPVDVPAMELSVPHGLADIEPDSHADLEELSSEQDKHELALCLERQVAESVVAIWKQRVAESMTVVDHEEGDDDDDDIDDDDDDDGPPTPPKLDATSRKLVPRISVDKNFKPVGVVNGVSRGDEMEGASRLNFGGSDVIPGMKPEVATQELTDLRSKLRKTNFDYSGTGTLRRPLATEPHQVDFRHVLKRKNDSGQSSPGDESF